MAWLKGKNLSPWTRVWSAWSATSKYRMKVLQKQAYQAADQSASSSKKGSKRKRKVKVPVELVMTYMNEYPQLKQSQGWTLVSSC